MDVESRLAIDRQLLKDAQMAELSLIITRRRYFERLVQGNGDARSNVEVVTKSRSYRLHRLQLAAIKAFPSQSDGQQEASTKLDLQDDDPDVVEALLKYLYTGALFTTISRNSRSSIDMSGRLTCIPRNVNSEPEWLYASKLHLLVPLVSDREIPPNLTLPVRKEGTHALSFYVDVFVIAARYKLTGLMTACIDAFVTGVKESQFYRDSLRGAFQGVKFVQTSFPAVYFAAVKRLFEPVPVTWRVFHEEVAKLTAQMRGDMLRKYDLPFCRELGFHPGQMAQRSVWNQISDRIRSELASAANHLIMANKYGPLTRLDRLKRISDEGMQPAADLMAEPQTIQSFEERCQETLEILNSVGTGWLLEKQGTMFRFKRVEPMKQPATSSSGAQAQQKPAP